MSAKSKAAKEFAQEQELGKLRAKKEAKESQLAAMTEPQRMKLQKRNKRVKIFVLAVVAFWVVIIIASVAGGSKNSTSSVATDKSASSPTADAGAQLSCDHFRNVASDLSKGLLTDAEMRTKIKEVYNDAWISTSPNIATAATAMLAADTAGDTTALKTAFQSFGAACGALGH